MQFNVQKTICLNIRLVFFSVFLLANYEVLACADGQYEQCSPVGTCICLPESESQNPNPTPHKNDGDNSSKESPDFKINPCNAVKPPSWCFNKSNE